MLALGVGLMALAGWVLDVEFLKGAGHSITMKPNAAIGLMLCGLSLKRFQQADSTTTREHGGPGLGLSIVRDLVELQGGSIEVQSAGQDCGAKFTVTFPRLDAAGIASADARLSGSSSSAGG